MNIAIFANGNLENETRALKVAQEADLVIAADGGAGHCLRLGLAPGLVIGDLDSLSETEKRALEAEGTEFSLHPSQKGETDLELALLAAAERKAELITVLGGTGGRLDMTIANVLLLALPALVGAEIRLLHANQTAWLVRPPGGRLHGQVGDTVSLIPLGSTASGISTDGLAYALAGGTLEVGPARGVSNVISGPEPRLALEEGMLLVVLTPAE